MSEPKQYVWERVGRISFPFFHEIDELTQLKNILKEIEETIDSRGYEKETCNFQVEPIYASYDGEEVNSFSVNVFCKRQETDEEQKRRIEMEKAKKLEMKKFKKRLNQDKDKEERELYERLKKKFEK